MTRVFNMRLLLGLSGLLIHQSKTEIKHNVYFNKLAFVAFVFAVFSKFSTTVRFFSPLDFHALFHSKFVNLLQKSNGQNYLLCP